MFLLLAAVAACEKKAAVVAEMGVSFEWNPSGTPVGRSPEIRLANVPEATPRFLAEIEDLNLKAYNHGCGDYPNDATLVIPAGGLDGYYQGPTPPAGVVHRYEFTE